MSWPSGVAISIHAPREGGDDCRTNILILPPISIHAPREGGDIGLFRDFPQFDRNFNPRPPRGGRRTIGAGIDGIDNFNPRPPRGGRPCRLSWQASWTEFQSTPPARGATNGHGRIPQAMLISIHAPREGGDVGLRVKFSPCANFNPRPPRGGRLGFQLLYGGLSQISIHAPREGGDSKDAQFYLRIFDK